MALVFQYGSNCSENQINGQTRLRGDARFIGVAETVDDFQLGFTVWGEKRQCAASDLVPCPGRKVYGAYLKCPMR